MVSSIDNKAEHMLRLVPTDFVCERNAHTKVTFEEASRNRVLDNMLVIA
jgi:hypothetical protein